MTTVAYPEGERWSAVQDVEKLLRTVATELPALLTEVCTCSNILKEAKLCTFNSTRMDSSDLPSPIATALQMASEAGSCKQFFTCCNTINDASNRLALIMEEAKLTRRKLDKLSLEGTTSAEQQSLQVQCIYLEQALALLYAIELDLHTIKLAANALYVHGQRAGAAELRETEGLKDATARLVAVLSSKHFNSSLSAPVPQ